MSDIVERLRERQRVLGVIADPEAAFMAEAADEIVRLRAERDQERTYVKKLLAQCDERDEWLAQERAAHSATKEKLEQQITARRIRG